MNGRFSVLKMKRGANLFDCYEHLFITMYIFATSNSFKLNK